MSALFAHGMKILGNGILNGCVWHPKEENGGGRPMIRLVFCNDVKIQGITMVDGGSWHMVPGACRNVEIEDVNIMSRVCTGDGIDIVGCEDVTLRNSFIRASDDCVHQGSKLSRPRRQPEREEHSGGALRFVERRAWQRCGDRL